MKKFLIGLTRWLIKLITILAVIILILEVRYHIGVELFNAILIIFGIGVGLAVVAGTTVWLLIAWALSVNEKAYEADN